MSPSGSSGGRCPPLYPGFYMSRGDHSRVMVPACRAGSGLVILFPHENQLSLLSRPAGCVNLVLSPVNMKLVKLLSFLSPRCQVWPSSLLPGLQSRIVTIAPTHGEIGQDFCPERYSRTLNCASLGSLTPISFMERTSDLLIKSLCGQVPPPGR